MDDPRPLLSRLAQAVDDAGPPPDLLHRAHQQRRRRNLTRTSLVGGVAALAIASTMTAVTLNQDAPDRSGDQSLLQATAPPAVSADSLRRATWTTGEASPDGARPDATLTWTGREVLVVGGQPGPTSRKASAYDPKNDTWRELTPAPNDLRLGPQVWLGDRLFTFPGSWQADGDHQPARGPALVYLPTQNRWQAAAPDPLGDLDTVTAVAVGTRVLVIGAQGGTLRAAWYDPATDTWTSTTTPSTPGHTSTGLNAVNTPAGVLVWSRWMHNPAAPSAPAAPGAGVDLLRLTDTWRDETAGWLQPLAVDDPQLLGDSIVHPRPQTYCGACSKVPSISPVAAGTIDPGSLQRNQLPLGPLDAARPTFVLTDGPVIAINLSSQIAVADGPVLTIGDTALYDPKTQTWTRLPSPPTAPAFNNRPVWAGDRLVTLSADGQPLRLQ